ncbi:primosomal protein N' [Jatrophihabitans telluris]|uniref:Probable replication restart protein PriA n=1 Tax=Jatrophihabitans telluris TaxID=2038343 RepID=A0ABY4R2L8_9ACTN|nr:primosomal protein N' [Jatrophihabitans telluris]UQX90065.1 primosomal protein N' [Jatrophihabitans telluris]
MSSVGGSSGRRPAAANPIARVAVDSPLPHLDRPFDYLVPIELDQVVGAGSRVRIRFAGRLVDGWVLSREPASEHDGRLAYLERGVGDEPVLTPETTALFRAVADRWAGTFADVVRLAVPPRHARAEAAAPISPSAPTTALQSTGWPRYRAGAAFVAAVAAHRPARAVWNILPDEDWPVRVAELVRTSVAAGRGAIVVVPDARDSARVDAALSATMPAGSHVLLSAELGPEARYRRWLAVRRGSVMAVVGNRSAVYAPVRDLGLIVLLDDGDDLHAEPRAPYPHARDVAVLRSALGGAALMIGGHAQTAEAALLLQSGWAQRIAASRDELRAAAPRVIATGDDFELERDPVARSARLPAVAFRAARQSLAAGHPVLLQVPRRGYVPSLACVKDRTPARCPTCSGPLAASGPGATPTCRWCGRAATDWHCPVCSGRALRAVVIGAGRTAEEIGRAFAGTVTRTSAGDQVLAEIPDGPSVVVATPGAEPFVAGGYGAALLLDGWALLSRADLRAGEEALRRWANAAALVRADGQVIVTADASLAPVQALVRWDPSGFAERELADRRELDFPPVSRMASLTGEPADVAELLALAHLPASAQELGSVSAPPPRRAGRPLPPTSETIRLLLRVPRADGVALAEALHAAAAVRSARKSGGPVRTALDPLELF